jgi:hypothetical protein
MSAATFGDLLAPARRYLDAATQASGRAQHSAAIIETAQVAGRLARTLSNYLGDNAPYGMAEVITNGVLTPQMRAAVDAREALQLAAESLQIAADDAPGSGTQPAGPLAASLSAAATGLAAGRDLMRTHFTTGPDGQWSTRSNWSAAICSAPVTRAITAEAASWSQRLAFLTERLSVASQADAAIAVPVRQGLAGASHWLQTASAIITAAGDPATAADTELLHAIPVIFTPKPWPQQGTEPADDLARGITASAARLHASTQVPARHAAWSPDMNAESWRWTATGAAIMFHISELMLNSLAERSGLFTGAPELSSQLRSTTDSASRACARWRDVAAAWKRITTATRGLTAPGVADATDLIVRLGRLAFTDPKWTPSRARPAPLRDPAELAPDAAQAAVILGAIHHTADTLACVASADLRAVSAAVRAARLFMPTHALPEYCDIPYRYGYAHPSRAAKLLVAYQAASDASAHAVTALDTVAVAMGSPSRFLALGRAASHVAQDPGTPNRAAGQPSEPGLAIIGDLEPKEALPPGLVERAVRKTGIGDPIMLLRAIAIDKAGRDLIAEARRSAREPDTPDPVERNSRRVPPSRHPARIAGRNFPVNAVVSKTVGPASQPSSPKGDHVTERPAGREYISRGRLHFR